MLVPTILAAAAVSSIAAVGRWLVRRGQRGGPGGMRFVPFAGTVAESSKHSRPGPEVLAVFAGIVFSYAVLAVFAVASSLVMGVPSGKHTYTVVAANEAFDAHGKLFADDVLVSLEGQAITELSADVDRLSRSTQGPIRVEVKRGDETVVVRVLPKFDEEGKRYRLGIGIEGKPVLERPPLGAAVASGITYPGRAAGEHLKSLRQVVGGGERIEVAGPIGIAHVVKKQSARERLALLLRLGSIGWLFAAFFDLCTIVWMAVRRRSA